MTHSDQPNHSSKGQDDPASEKGGGEGGWIAKFAYAFRGVFWACRTQSSFWIHVPIAVVVLLVAAALQVDVWEWVALIIVIGTVISAELANTAIEQIAKVVHPEHDVRIGQALDAAAGAVLAVAISAVCVGLIVLGPKLWHVLV